ncbi:MAG: hypothetical protein KC912_15320 [Proteobacteria bacterium]|nr:hypothetical protein [Pseudomonadota bacterium]
MSQPAPLPWSRSLGPAGALLVFRAFLMFVATTSEHWVPLQFHTGSAEANGRAITAIDLRTQLSTWDAHHYLSLATDGYEAGTNAAAFYPLWPAVIGAVSTVLGDPLVAALLSAHLFFGGALVLLHRWAALRGGPDRADRFILLFAAFPGALFFGLAYSESLFLLLSAGLFLLVDRKHWVGVGLLAVLLALTRAVGLFAVVPLAWAAWKSRDRRAWIAPLGAVAGFGAYLATMAALTGSAWTGFEAQKLFINNSSPMALVDLPRFFRAMFAVDGLHGVTGSALDRLFFVVWALALVPLYKRDRVAFLWTAALGWVSVSGVGFMAFTRYLAVLFPVFWVAADALEPEAEQPWTTYMLVVSLGFAMQVIFLLRYLSHYWVG